MPATPSATLPPSAASPTAQTIECGLAREGIQPPSPLLGPRKIGRSPRVEPALVPGGLSLSSELCSWAMVPAIAAAAARAPTARRPARGTRTTASSNRLNRARTGPRYAWLATYWRIATGTRQSATQQFADGPCHSPRLTLQLAPGETHHLVTERLQPRVPSSVLLEGRSSPVGFSAVNLDDQAFGAPEEVDSEAIHEDIHFRLGKAVTPSKGQEHPLQVRARSVRMEPIPDRQTKIFGLSQRPGKVAPRQDAAKVFERADRHCHRDPVPNGAITLGKRPRPVQADSVPGRPSAIAGDRHVDNGCG